MKIHKLTMYLVAAAFTGSLFIAGPVAAQSEKAKKEELQTLITATPEEGFQLALKLSRKAVTETQKDKSVLKKGRPEYSTNPDSLIAVSHVVATNFQTVAAANNYWRDKK